MLIPFITWKEYKYYPSLRTVVKLPKKSYDIKISLDQFDFCIPKINCKNDLSLLIYLGSKCNFKCPYCFVSKDINNTVIDIEKIVKTIRELDIKSLIFLGGEPVFYIDTIKKILDYVSNIKILIYSNGYSLVDDVYRVTEKYDTDYMLTIHTDNFAAIDKCKEYYNKLNLDSISKNKLHLSYMITSHNAIDLLDYFVEQYNEKVFTFSIYPGINLSNSCINDIDITSDLLNKLWYTLDINKYHSLWDRTLINQSLQKQRCTYNRLYVDKNNLYGCVGACTLENFKDLICDFDNISTDIVQDYRSTKLNSIYKEECNACFGNINCFFSTCPYIPCSKLIKSVSITNAVMLSTRILEKLSIGVEVGNGQIQQYIK